MITDAELSARLQFAMEQGSVMEFYVEPLRELQQLRAAKQADEERVRQVVESVALSEIDVKTTWPADRIAPIARAIATRVASQLASAAPVLSESERDDLEIAAKGLRGLGRLVGAALLDRLLGASR